MKKKSRKAALEETWVRTRDALDAIRARETEALAKKHMGDCFIDVSYESGESKPGRDAVPSVYSYFKVVGAKDGSIVYMMLHLQANGLIQIEPRHKSGRYVIDHYKPLQRGLFKLRYKALLQELQQWAPKS